MLNVIIGVDVGNSTTEVAMATLDENNKPIFLKSVLAKTTGTKGTTENIAGIKTAIKTLTGDYEEIKIEKVLLNDAAPVIADFAMDTITETVITDSAMIGHNPDTPGGIGLGVGITALIGDDLTDNSEYIIVIPQEWKFDKAACKINTYTDKGIRINGIIACNDEGTLINNRLDNKVPIVDEVTKIKSIPLGVMCAVEVAPVGYCVDTLSNPFGIATVFDLDAEETEYCKAVAKALIGNRSAVVIKTPKGDIKERVIPAGKLQIIGQRYTVDVPVDNGAELIMEKMGQVEEIVDIKGESGTNIGGMLENVRVSMAKKCDLEKETINISDVFAVDSYTAVPVRGGLSNESSLECGVAMAAMIHADKKFMQKVAEALEEDLAVPVEVCGIEGEMAMLGALTTPGTKPPMVMIDIGAGSTDAAFIDKRGQIRSVHLAGAGDMITTLINSELDLRDFDEAEQIKKFPLAKIDDLYRVKHEDGNVEYKDKPLDAEFYGRIVTVSSNGTMQLINTDKSVELIRKVRREAKEKVLVANVMRALHKLGVDSSDCKQIVLVGGTVEDFELSNILTLTMARERITAGKGNIRGCEGPRNAVATGLIKSYYEKE